ncbi:MAG: zf-HC2 domain-containing protein [Lentisphaerae bacterium]|nr:zf-HC2 domain-containing protein [Lentisphaerota bacterium]
MKRETDCKQARGFLLLARSGELGPRNRARLDRHLAACAACRTRAAETERLSAAVARALPEGCPSGAALTRIRAHAAEQTASAPHPLRRPSPAWACAAALALIAGIWFARLPPARDTRIRAVAAAMAIVAEDSAATNTAAAASHSLEALAARILEWEGLEPNGEAVTDLFNEDASLPSTRTQSRNTRAFSGRIYG